MNLLRYWGSKPATVIYELIESNSREGDIVLDPFGGKGITVSEALRLARKPIYNDLNPYAHFLAKTVLSQMDINSFANASQEVVCSILSNGVADLYDTKCSCGQEAEIGFVVWSTSYTRRKSRKAKLAALEGSKSKLNKLAALIYNSVDKRKFTHEELMKSVSNDSHLKTVRRNLITLAINRILIEQNLFSRVKEKPLLIRYLHRCSCGLTSRPPFRSHIKNLRQINEQELHPVWSSTELRYDDGDYFYKRRNINLLEELFTPRNLLAITALRDKVLANKYSQPVEDGLMLVLSSILFSSSKMQRPESGSWPVPCYWIPPTFIERNVFHLFQTRCNRFASFKSRQFLAQSKGPSGASNRDRNGEPVVHFLKRNAINLNLAANSVDYILADPPQTDEIQYFELSYLTSQFLGFDLPFAQELVVNPRQGKYEDWYWKMMRKAFEEFVRILKPGGRMTILLHGENKRYFNKMFEIVHSAPVRVLSNEFQRYGFKNYFHNSDLKRLNGDFYLTMEKHNGIIVPQPKE